MGLDRAFFTGRETQLIAQDLLGHELIMHSAHGDLGGVIVETEAYLGDKDTAAHAFGHRKSKANAALYSEPGTLYLYTMRGLILMNLICQPEGTPQGILLRGLQPTTGVDEMAANRGRQDYDVSNGPAKLTAALGITDLAMNDVPLAKSLITVSTNQVLTPRVIEHSARIGVSKGEWEQRELRFYVGGNPYVSGMKKREMDLDMMGWQGTLNR